MPSDDGIARAHRAPAGGDRRAHPPGAAPHLLQERLRPGRWPPSPAAAARWARCCCSTSTSRPAPCRSSWRPGGWTPRWAARSSGCAADPAPATCGSPRACRAAGARGHRLAGDADPFAFRPGRSAPPPTPGACSPAPQRPRPLRLPLRLPDRRRGAAPAASAKRAGAHRAVPGRRRRRRLRGRPPRPERRGGTVSLAARTRRLLSGLIEREILVRLPARRGPAPPPLLQHRGRVRPRHQNPRRDSRGQISLMKIRTLR